MTLHITNIYVASQFYKQNNYKQCLISIVVMSRYDKCFVRAKVESIRSRGASFKTGDTFKILTTCLTRKSETNKDVLTALRAIYTCDFAVRFCRAFLHLMSFALAVIFQVYDSLRFRSCGLYYKRL
jgi:hypothetical protein